MQFCIYTSSVLLVKFPQLKHSAIDQTVLILCSRESARHPNASPMKSTDENVACAKNLVERNVGLPLPKLQMILESALQLSG